MEKYVERKIWCLARRILNINKFKKLKKWKKLKK